MIFIAHSLGGVIVKKALVLSHQNHRNRREIIDATTGIVFLGTPHHDGSFDNISRVLRYFSPTLVGENELKSQCSRLSMVSELLHTQKTFEVFLERKLHRFRLISFFEELPIPGFGLVCESYPSESRFSDPRQVVDERLEPASLYTVLPIHADHSVRNESQDSNGVGY